MKCNKHLCAIGAIIAIIIAIICILPAFSYKECKETKGDQSYCKHIKEYWSLKFRKAEHKTLTGLKPEEPEDKPADEKPEVEGKLQTVQVIEE